MYYQDLWYVRVIDMTQDQVSIHVPVHFNTAYGNMEKLSCGSGPAAGDKAISTKN